MAKSKTVYVCSECGYETPRWLGRCPECGNWNTLVEQECVPEVKTAEKKLRRAPGLDVDALRVDQIPDDVMARRSCGIAELDRVLGGGLVPGSAILIGGDPGIGKSTLLLLSTTSTSATNTSVSITLNTTIATLKLLSHLMILQATNICMFNQQLA